MSIYNTCDKCGKMARPLQQFKEFSHYVNRENYQEVVFKKPIELCYPCYKEAVKKEKNKK